MLNDLILLDGVSNDHLQGIKQFINEWNDESYEIEVETSGSTGTPKKIKLLKSAVRKSAQATGLFFDLQPGQTALLNLSVNYIAGKLMIVRAIEHQMNLVVAPLNDNPLLNEYEGVIDFAAMVPAQVKSVLESAVSSEKLKKIKNIIIGGAPLNPQIENELTTLDCRCFVTFGMTETITHFALRKVGTPIYRCLPGFKCSIDDRSCLVLAENEILPEPLITNDIIDLIDAETFKWRGRYDFVINSGGVKIHPEKVEKMIGHLFPNNRFYVTSKQDDQFGEIAILLIEGQLEEDSEELLKVAKSFLPKYHCPKEAYFKGAFNYTESGKIIREKF